MPVHPTRRITDVDGAAEYLHTTVRHVRELVYKRQIPFTKVGRLVRFDLDQIDAWLDTHSTAVAS